MTEICDVIIPVYNSPEWLELCVEAAVASDCSNAIRSILLIDDCSNDETKALIRRLCGSYARVVSVQNEKNLGFVKTCNRGMKHSTADYMLLLNSDCLLAKDTIARLVRLMKAYPAAGLVCPLSNNAANLSIPIPREASYVQVDRLLSELPDKDYQACTVVGNCLMISRACYESTGGLDEAFGMGYGEETDYQFRAAKAGFGALVAGNAYVFHKSQMSFGSSDTLNTQKKKNRDLFFERWGEEYDRLMLVYEKNDPARAAQRYMKENAGRIGQMDTEPFCREFLKRVQALDQTGKKETGSCPAFAKCRSWIRELGAYRALRRGLKKLRHSGKR